MKILKKYIDWSNLIIAIDNADKEVFLRESEKIIDYMWSEIEFKLLNSEEIFFNKKSINNLRTMFNKRILGGLEKLFDFEIHLCPRYYQKETLEFFEAVFNLYENPKKKEIENIISVVSDLLETNVR